MFGGDPVGQRMLCACGIFLVQFIYIVGMLDRAQGVVAGLAFVVAVIITVIKAAPLLGILNVALLLVAVIGFVRVGSGAWGGVGRWVVAAGFLSIILYSIICRLC